VTDSINRMAAMTARYYYLLRSSWLRLAELIFWPAMQMLVWGFLYTYLYDSKSSMASTGGILLGAVVTPETLRGVTTWPVSIALLMLCTVVMMLATSSYLRVVHRWDPLSALLGASPGAMAQVIALSSELGGDLRAIAIVQTMRVLLIVIGLPNGLALFGLVVPAVAVARGPADISVLGQMIVLVMVSVSLAVAFLYLRLPGGLMFGALTGSGLLHGTGYIHAVLPWWIGSSSVIALGALVGSRFANTSARMLVGYLGAALGSFAVSMAVAARERFFCWCKNLSYSVSSTVQPSSLAISAIKSIGNP